MGEDLREQPEAEGELTDTADALRSYTCEVLADLILYASYHGMCEPVAAEDWREHEAFFHPEDAE